MNDPNLIYPVSRVNELFNSFLNNEDFDDLSISRSNFKWGIPIKENSKHVIYVWLDALSSYLTGLGYLQKNDKNFLNYWESQDCEIIQLMAKEITRFHCIYWPIMLEMLGLRKPTHYISHGWIITEKGKMSKSLGNVLDPIYFVNKYGRDAFRYYLVKEISIKEDSIFSEELFISVFNKDLANTIGNLINRTIGMVNKYVGGVVPKYENPSVKENVIFLNKILDFDKKIIEVIEKNNIQKIVKVIQDFMIECNQFIEFTKPWNLKKENKIDELNSFLTLVVNSVKRIIYYLEPILIDGTKIAWSQFNIKEKNLNIN
ncbi:MAG: methionine--tRNA ligase [Malacoplasma sp.]|nr:methionine--tRNA ligase [Malacoplasma sp.]